MPKRKASGQNSKKGAKRGRKDNQKTAKREDTADEERKELEKTGDKVENAANVMNDAKTIIADAILKTTAADAREGNLKIVSWNCAGLRAWVKKDGLAYLKKEDPDIICLQETKCSEKDCPLEIGSMKIGRLGFSKEAENDKYNMYFSMGDKKGYSGTALWSKKKPLKVTYGLGIKKHDNEGRMITAEYETFYLITTYVPNSGRGLVRLSYRMEWEKDMKDYLKKLNNVKPVILCGDLNVAHNEIDIANPKANQKNAGFSKEERAAFTELLDEGFVDSYRHLNPKTTGSYTFWTYMSSARERNIGWRLDYFVLSKSILGNLCDSVTRPAIKGSDHCPVVLTMAIQTEAIAETKVVAETEAIADTKVVAQTEAIAETNIVVETDPIADTKVVAETEAIAVTKIVTETEAIAVTKIVTEN